MLTVLLMNWLYIIIIMLLVWGIYLWTQNPGVMDAFWSIAIAFSGLHYSVLHHASVTLWLFRVLLLIWAIRLAGYLLFSRVIPNHIEARYKSLSSNWRLSKKIGFLLNFQFQGFLAMIIALPFLFIGHSLTFNAISLLSILCFFIGLVGESIADYQLYSFRRQRTGRVCDIGLWRYSRHPNYFFECLIWFSFALAALSTPWGWLAFLSPILLLVLMLKVTGPITERCSITSKGKLYEDYQQKTSMFIPLPVKRNKS